MKAFILTLRILAAAFIAVSALHFFMGPGADAILGAPITQAMLADPSIDNQNRFYGVTFSLLGVALLVSATDLRRYRPIINATLGVLLMAGVARIVSWGIHGAPSPAIIGILCADIILPPVLYVWLKQTLRDTSQ
ncbi:DUF4345 domain-containing protein [Bradyrhizobium tropiciagri]|uniref:DUF4345 domain-containing protein n=1 Tax=Bradyrhizobium tropiciagri TaxID=312253 RepID=UPI00067B9FCF|nr:DUF4345 domain-containing protein [Bradyrhizobium tropiciagri]